MSRQKESWAVSRHVLESWGWEVGCLWEFTTTHLLTSQGVGVRSAIHHYSIHAAEMVHPSPPKNMLGMSLHIGVVHLEWDQLLGAGTAGTPHKKNGCSGYVTRLGRVHAECHTQLAGLYIHSTATHWGPCSGHCVGKPCFKPAYPWGEGWAWLLLASWNHHQLGVCCLSGEQAGQVFEGSLCQRQLSWKFHTRLEVVGPLGAMAKVPQTAGITCCMLSGFNKAKVAGRLGAGWACHTIRAATLMPNTTGFQLG